MVTTLSNFQEGFFTISFKQHGYFYMPLVHMTQLLLPNSPCVWKKLGPGRDCELEQVTQQAQLIFQCKEFIVESTSIFQCFFYIFSTSNKKHCLTQIQLQFFNAFFFYIFSTSNKKHCLTQIRCWIDIKHQNFDFKVFLIFNTFPDIDSTLKLPARTFKEYVISTHTTTSMFCPQNSCRGGGTPYPTLYGCAQIIFKVEAFQVKCT